MTIAVGTEWLIDAEGCAPEALRQKAILKWICEMVIADLDLHVLGQPMWHSFPDPGGVTGLYLLTESHLACHTYPETGIATFNLYCCRPRQNWPWKARLSEILSAERVRVRTLNRGAKTDSEVKAR